MCDLFHFFSMATERFEDRRDAGEQLASQLESYAHKTDAIVLALPRGGVPVGYAVAKALGVPLDVMLVRKLGVPGHEELAMGAVAAGGRMVLANDVVRMAGIPDNIIQAAARRELAEIERREKLYRSGRPPLQLQDRVVILVDDGLATGSTMLAAVQAARVEHPAKIVAAVPVGAPDTCLKLGSEADEVICLRTPEPFYAVGLWYRDFAQTSDEEVIRLLDEASHDQAAQAGSIAAARNGKPQNQPGPPDGR
jgi:putative phosphoribosyl transferase